MLEHPANTHAAMTNALNPLPPQLYSHGSATLMTLQQVAGAAGTALLIAIMAIRTGALTHSGVDALHAQLGGIHASFLVGAVAAAGAFVLSAGNLYDTDALLAGIVVLSLLGLAVSWVIGVLERVALRWR